MSLLKGHNSTEYIVKKNIVSDPHWSKLRYFHIDTENGNMKGYPLNKKWG